MGYVVNANPRPIYPLERTRYQLYRRLGGSQIRSGQVRKISPTPGFDPRTVQPAASRYADWAVAAAIRKMDSVERRYVFFQLAGLLSRKDIAPFILLHIATGPLYIHAHTVSSINIRSLCPSLYRIYRQHFLYELHCSKLIPIELTKPVTQAVLCVKVDHSELLSPTAEHLILIIKPTRRINFSNLLLE